MQTFKRPPITSNGVYPVNAHHGGSQSAVLLAGEDGGATARLITFDREGNEVPLVDGADQPLMMVINTQDVVQHGAGNTFYIKVAGATGTTKMFLTAYPI